MTQAPWLPGWYPDPNGAPCMRWFDGAGWTEYQGFITPAPVPQSRRADIAIRLMLWLAFSVVFGCVPLLVDGVKSGMSAKGFDLDDVLGHGHGGLFVVGAVIAGGSIGELIAAFVTRNLSGKRTSFKIFAILAGLATLLMLVANTAGYMTDAEARAVRDASEWFFAITLLPTGAIIWMVTTP